MKKDIELRNKKYQKHGLWEIYNASDSLIYNGFFHNGKLVGYNEFSSVFEIINKKIYHL